MRKVLFIIGGCRSGKSSHALNLADQIPGHKIFIATCMPHDKRNGRTDFASLKNREAGPGPLLKSRYAYLKRLVKTVRKKMSSWWIA